MPSNHRRKKKPRLLIALMSGLATASLARPGMLLAQPETPAASAVPANASVERLFADFLHYARIGRFNLADSHAAALLAHAELDAVKVMELANKDRKSLDTLLILIKNSTISENASRVLALIEKGEAEKRKSADRILENIEKLGGDPQQEDYAIRQLARSGEYAVPHLVQTLLDPAKSRLHGRVVKALPLIGKPAVNPLVIALPVQNEDVRLHVIGALGEIGYAQAVPYLSRLMIDPTLSELTRSAAANAIARIQQIGGRAVSGSPEAMFTDLAERYYNEEDVVRADPRLDEANVWYWEIDEQVLRRVAVQTRIFGQIMAMRCCGEAMLIRNDHSPALSLWLAANIRREHRLGLNVESGDPNESGEKDPTRPAQFPRALYFTQAAGPRYAHDVLARAVKDGDSPVALGAIEALRITAGEASLVGVESYKQPLIQALEFSDIVVRIRAALAMGAALPKSQFDGSHRVIPVLASALALSGREQMIVVDPEESNANRVAGMLRDAGHEVIAEGDFFRAFERARSEFTNVAGLWIAADVREPALGDALRRFRTEYVFAKTPVVVLSRSGYELVARELAETDPYVEPAAAPSEADALRGAYARAAARAGRAPVDADVARVLALLAADTMQRMALDGRTVLNLSVAEPALIAVLHVNDEGLQTRCAAVLAALPTPTAQRAVAHLAMTDDNTVSLRVAAFSALADSAKANGNLLEPGQIDRLVALARDAANLVIRTSASEALGALNLAANQAGEIIRSYHEG